MPATSAWNRPVLGIDTSGEGVSVALFQPASAAGSECLRELSAPEGSRASAALHPLIDRLLRDEGLSPMDLGLVAVVRGPGSFTGTRVGLSTASGLGLGTGLPAMGVLSTAACSVLAGRAGNVLIVLDGGQGRVFVAEHDVTTEGRVQTLREPEDSSVEEACARARALGGLSYFRGRPRRLEELQAAGCRELKGPLAGACARLAATGQATPGLSPFYGKAPAIRPGPPLIEPKDVPG